jgi:predicted dehydrogenase
MTSITRRRFLSQSTAALAALSAVGVTRGAQSTNEKVVLALIGAGGRGQQLALSFAQLPGVQFKYVCDVETPKREAMCKALQNATTNPAAPLADMRQALDDKDVHAVIIALPEHWHALAAVWACQAGKDVYVEKNLAINVWEGQKMLQAARKYNRILQAGFQCRSAPYAATARDYIRSGKLGKVAHVKVFNLLNGSPWKVLPDSETPPGLDWDRWLGPAAKVPYNASRHRNWYYWFDYCGGTFGGDASHQLDLARMVLGDPPDPKAVYCAGGNFAFGSQCPTPEMMAITYEFDDFVMTCESANFPPYLRKSTNDERNGDKFPYWPLNNERIEIYGTKQMMYVGRHGVGWQAIEAEGKVVAQEHGVHPDQFHQPNFLDCIKTRRQPNANVQQAYHSSNLVHLANTAFRTGNQLLRFDATTQRFVNHDPANTLLRPPQREGYRIPDEV